MNDASTDRVAVLESRLTALDARLVELAQKTSAARPEPEPTHALLAMAQREYRNRRRRERVLDAPDLFADPAWDILLDLFIAHLEGKAISTSSACIASCVPLTTALRWITALENEGMLRRVADPRDRRRVYVEITGKARERMIRYFEDGAD